MDVRMPGTDGLQATRRILDDEEYLFEAIRAGAAGFLLEDTAPDGLRDAVRIVAGGDALLSPAVTRRVLEAAGRSPAARPERLADLTDRERDVLAQVGAGRANAQIGTILHISPDTARTDVSRLLGKLDARDRSQLVVIAYASGLVRPGDR